MLMPQVVMLPSRDGLTKILNTLEDGTNVFIISHKGDILENKFRSKIEFIKEKNFSKIK